jgi:hypothetical protein
MRARTYSRYDSNNYFSHSDHESLQHTRAGDAQQVVQAVPCVDLKPCGSLGQVPRAALTSRFFVVITLLLLLAAAVVATNTRYYWMRYATSLYYVHCAQPRTFASVLEEACTMIADEQLDSLPGEGRTFDDVRSDVSSTQAAVVADVDCVHRARTSSSSSSSSSSPQQTDDKLLILQ